MTRRTVALVAIAVSAGTIAVASHDTAGAYNPCAALQRSYAYHVDQGNTTFAVTTIGDLLGQYRCTPEPTGGRLGSNGGNTSRNY